MEKDKYDVSMIQMLCSRIIKGQKYCEEEMRLGLSFKMLLCNIQQDAKDIDYTDRSDRQFA